MNIPRRDTHGAVGFDMTPMIDIVFQLIIFFLLTGQLVKQETQVKLALPEATSGEEDTADDAPRLTVNVQGDGQVSLGSGLVNMAELTERLAEKRASVGSTLEVRIRSDRSVPYRIVEPIMLACAKVNIWNVKFAVYRPGESP
jgi:biopolymer transport protein ExbD